MLVTSRDRNRFSLQRHWKTPHCLFIKQTSCWHKPNIAARKVSFTLRSLHFTFINMHICYLYTPTFSSKSLICLLWISVLSSRSRILCKNRKKMECVFFSPYIEAEWASGCILQGLPGEPGAAVPSSPGGSGSRTRDSSSASASSASPPPSAAHPSAAHPEVRHILSPEGRFFLFNLSWVILFLHTFPRWSDK